MEYKSQKCEAVSHISLLKFYTYHWTLKYLLCVQYPFSSTCLCVYVFCSISIYLFCNCYAAYLGSYDLCICPSIYHLFLISVSSSYLSISSLFPPLSFSLSLCPPLSVSKSVCLLLFYLHFCFHHEYVPWMCSVFRVQRRTQSPPKLRLCAIVRCPT